MGAWIEIGQYSVINVCDIVAPCMGAWIEISSAIFLRVSLSGRSLHPCKGDGVGAWIEIGRDWVKDQLGGSHSLHPRKGDVLEALFFM